MTDSAPLTAPSSRRRGSYAKGVAKREEILARALEVIAREGYAGASIKALADAVGLSQAGLLHYFDSKEELFAAILRKRDEVDAARFGEQPERISVEALYDGYIATIRHNSETPGLVALFSRLAVDASDPTHPAHAVFAERTRVLRELMTDAVATAQTEGTMNDRVAPEVVARILQAVADGMQLQWLLDPDVDMAEPVSAVFELLGARDALIAGEDG